MFGMRCNRPNCSYVHIKLKSGRNLGSVGIVGGELVEDVDVSKLTFDKSTNLYVLDDSSMPAGVMSVLEEGRLFEEESGEISADPLGLCCALEVGSDSGDSNGRPHRWSQNAEGRHDEAHKRDKAAARAVELGPFQFGAWNSEPILESSLKFGPASDFPGLADK